MRRALLISATLALLVAAVAVLWLAGVWWGARSPGFAVLLTWTTMTWTGVASRLTRVALPEGYYRIRLVERDGRVYRYLGVRLAKTLLRRGPLAVFNPRLRLPARRTTEALGDLDAAMRQAETSHLVAMVPVVLFAGYAASRGWMGAAGWALAANLLVNGYPVMLQRYNRAWLAGLRDPTG